MSTKLVLGMEFLRQNMLMLNAGDRILSRRPAKEYGFDWIIDEDGNPQEIRFIGAKCVLRNDIVIQANDC